jgi:rRNA-processing protein FCF1
MDQLLQRCNMLKIGLSAVLLSEIPKAVCTDISTVTIVIEQGGNIIVAGRAENLWGNKAATATVSSPNSLDDCGCIVSHEIVSDEALNEQCGIMLFRTLLIITLDAELISRLRADFIPVALLAGWPTNSQIRRDTPTTEDL